MDIFHIILSIICLWLSWRYIRLCGDIRSLRRQLDVVARGSHIELAANNRYACLLKLCKRLNQVLSAKDTAYFQYEKAERQLKQNITNLAHDIRTPLTGASGYVQLARESSDSEKKERYLQTAESRLTELEDMLEKLFLYTKLTGEDFRFAPERMKEIQLLPFLGDCLLSLYVQFEKAGSSPEVQFASEDCRVYAEEEALRRIFLNLIQNALIHGTGELSIYQKEDTDEKTGTEKMTCLIFENPVPAGHLIDPTQIFDRFYKADPARGKASSGLGLYIVKELMQKMGGTVSAGISGNKLQIVLLFAANDQ